MQEESTASVASQFGTRFFKEWEWLDLKTCKMVDEGYAPARQYLGTKNTQHGASFFCSIPAVVSGNIDEELS